MPGHHLIMQSENTNRYRAVIKLWKRHIGYTIHLTTLFCKDTEGKMNPRWTDRENKGLVACGQYPGNSCAVELIVPIHAD